MVELVQARAGKDQTERKPGTFLPGNVPPKTRTVGQINKITRDLKNGLFEAAENLGRDGYGEGGLVGYLEFLGWKHPKAFAGLLGKVLPMQVNTNAGTNYIASVNIISVPTDNYLSAEDMERMRKPTQQLIDAEAEPEQQPDCDTP